MRQNFGHLEATEFLQILKRRWGLIVVLTVVFGIIGFGVSKWLIPPLYQSDASVIVQLPPSSEKDAGNDYNQVSAAQQLANTYALIMKSDTVLNNVIKNRNLTISITELQSDIQVSNIAQTPVIDITVRSREPQAAADIANEVIADAPSVINNTVSMGSLRIISPAKKADNPVSPNKVANAIISALAGLAIAVLSAFCAEMLNNTFTSGADIEKYLQYPVLAVIPYAKRKPNHA